MQSNIFCHDMVGVGCCVWRFGIYYITLLKVVHYSRFQQTKTT